MKNMKKIEIMESIRLSFQNSYKRDMYKRSTIPSLQRMLHVNKAHNAQKSQSK